MGDVIYGKPCVASSEGMEGQNKIEINKINISEMKVKVMHRIMMVLWQHILRNFLLHYIY